MSNVGTDECGKPMECMLCRHNSPRFCVTISPLSLLLCPPGGAWCGGFSLSRRLWQVQVLRSRRSGREAPRQSPAQPSTRRSFVPQRGRDVRRGMRLCSSEERTAVEEKEAEDARGSEREGRGKWAVCPVASLVLFCIFSLLKYSNAKRENRSW